MRRFIVPMGVGAALCAVPAIASAQPPDQQPAPLVQPMPPQSTFVPPPEAPAGEHKLVPAPANAFEITIGTGYTQGFGMVREGLSVPDVATPGVGFDLGLGYRLDPRFALMAYGQYHELTAERADSARGLTMSLALQYHMSPLRTVDPWVEVGAGYRFLWEVPAIGPTITTSGIQLARARFGVDFRADPALAVGPVVGADLNMFFFQDTPGLSTNIADTRVNTFIYAGIQGRFDVGGQTRTSAGVRTASAQR